VLFYFMYSYYSSSYHSFCLSSTLTLFVSSKKVLLHQVLLFLNPIYLHSFSFSFWKQDRIGLSCDPFKGWV
jgi:hypothetical protein